MLKLTHRLSVILLIFLCPLSVSAMEFGVFDGDSKCSGCLIIKADGVITESTPDKFKEFLTGESLNSKRITVVVLDSPGGSLWGGLEFGRLIRSKGFDTHIGKVEIVQGNELNILDGQCASACAYAFLGGKDRSKELKSKYGLHQISTTTTSNVPLSQAIKSTQNLLSEVSKYVENMGVSPEIVTIATHTESERINWIDSSAMITYRVINSSGLSQQKPWEMVQPKTWSVSSVLDNGAEELIVMTCSEIPGRLNKRGHVRVSITPSTSLPQDSPYVNGYSPVVVFVRLGKNEISRADITVFFAGVEQSIHGIEIPFWAINDALRSNIELSVSISYPDSFPAGFSLQRHLIPNLGLDNVITELGRSCPHLGG